MKTIRIFIASSSELKEDRDQFRMFISTENDRLHKNDIYLELVQWEYFLDAISDTRLQDEYNNAICECDIVLCLFFTKVGKFSAEEFDTAYQVFKDKGKPRIWTYFKDAQISTRSITKEINTLLLFQEKIRDLGHFYTEYTNIDNLINKYRTQLDKFLPQFELFLVDYDKILEWDWSNRKLLRHLIALDYETTENLNEENEGTADQWAPVFAENPNCWKLLAVRDKELVGYWCFFALQENIYQEMKSGQLPDSVITTETVRKFNAEGTYNIYFCMFCIKENYRKRGFKILFKSIRDELNKLNNKGMRINEICANAFSEEGEDLCGHLGMKFTTNHFESGKMYIGKFEDMQKTETWKNFENS